MEPLQLERRALEEMFAHARAEHPDECCGAVVRRAGHDQVLRFTNIQNRLHEADPVANPRTAATAYSPEPQELFDATRRGDEPGAALTVFYHSHAINGSYFSDEDQARATWDGDPVYPDVAYVVVSDARVPDEARAFRWNEAERKFTEVPIELA